MQVQAVVLRLDAALVSDGLIFGDFGAVLPGKHPGVGILGPHIVARTWIIGNVLFAFP